MRVLKSLFFPLLAALLSCGILVVTSAHAQEVRVEMRSMPAPLMDKGYLTRYVYANVVLVLPDESYLPGVCGTHAQLDSQFNNDLLGRRLVIQQIDMHLEKARTELIQLAALTLPEGALSNLEINWTSEPVEQDALIAGTMLADRCSQLGAGGA